MIINVKVKPNSGRQEIKKINDNEYLINLKQTARNNKANLELLKLLTRHFKKNIKIKAGLASKRKIIEISDN